MYVGNNKTISIVISVVCLFFLSYCKKNRAVDEQEALKIAEDAAIGYYGKEKIEKQKPLKITLQNDVWHVSGTFNCPYGQHCKGGVVHVEISKMNGEVLKMIHGK